MAYDVVIYGLGGRLDSLARMLDDENIHVVAFMDGSPEKRGQEYRGKAVLGPEDAGTISFDYVLVYSTFYPQIRTRLLSLGVPREKIVLVNAVSDRIFADLPVKPGRELNCSGYLDYMRGLRNKTASILSNDCWGGITSQMLGAPFFSPFVGIHIDLEGYVGILERLDEHLQADLEFITNGAACPVAMLGAARLEFRHYRSDEHARAKWLERRDRVNPDNLFVKLGLGEPFQAHLIERFNRLPYRNKVCFTAFDPQGAPGCIHLPELAGQQTWGKEINEVTASRLRFDVVSWLNGEPVPCLS